MALNVGVKLILCWGSVKLCYLGEKGFNRLDL